MSLEIVLILIVIVAVAMFLNNNYLQSKGINHVISLKHLEGIPGLTSGQLSMISVKTNELVINQVQILPYSRIKKTEVISSTQISEKQKSVIKRALAGGILLGPLGAVVGGLSGVGKKETSETVYMYSIDFVNIEGVESNALFLLEKGYMLPELNKIKDYINNKIGYYPPAQNNVPHEI